MKNKTIIALAYFLFINISVLPELRSEIINKIVVKVGNELVTSIDVKSEIIKLLVLNKQKITQENINSNKNYAVKNLVNTLIKKNEIDRFKIKTYNEIDLKKYTEGVAANMNTNISGLKKIFNENGIDYNILVEQHKTELLWNSLIFEIYKNQININMVEIANEIEVIKGNTNNKQLKDLKKEIVNRKKNDKLNLFSRSHFSNLENTVSIDFQ